MRVPLTSYGAREIAAGSVAFIAALAVSVKVLWPAAIPVGLLWAGLLAFFRDPERRVEAAPGGLLSPADGTVRDVGEAEALRSRAREMMAGVERGDYRQGRRI